MQKNLARRREEFWSWFSENEAELSELVINRGAWFVHAEVHTDGRAAW